MENKFTLEEKYQLIKENIINSDEKDPIKLIKTIMHKDFINIHGPEHHFLDGASFLVALKNNGLNIDLVNNLDELKRRTINMPGAMCGYWGICGSVASLGAVFSIIDGTGPLSNSFDYKKHMSYTSTVINEMSKIGGPRCCKRNAFLSILYAIEYANINYGLSIGKPKIVCEFSNFNKQCLRDDCPFFKQQ